MIRHLFVFAVVFMICADAQAVIRNRTFEITGQGAGWKTETVPPSPGQGTFSYDDADWDGGVIDNSELLSTFQVTSDDTRFTSVKGGPPR